MSGSDKEWESVKRVSDGVVRDIVGSGVPLDVLYSVLRKLRSAEFPEGTNPVHVKVCRRLAGIMDEVSQVLRHTAKLSGGDAAEDPVAAASATGKTPTLDMLPPGKVTEILDNVAPDWKGKPE